MQLGELGAECGLKGFGVFVDYAVVAIVEFCVMENLAVVLLFSALLSRGGEDEHGTHLRTILHKVRDRRVSPALQILLHHHHHIHQHLLYSFFSFSFRLTCTGFSACGCLMSL